MAVGDVLIIGNTNGDAALVSSGAAGTVLTSNGTGVAPTYQASSGGGSWIPLVDGSEPPVFITDGAGVLILVGGPA